MTDRMNLRAGDFETYVKMPAAEEDSALPGEPGSQYEPESQGHVKKPVETIPVLTPAAPVPHATWGKRAAVAKWTFGLIRPSAGEAEQAYLAAEHRIRQCTWTRAVNVMVANCKGGVGKSPTSLLIGGALARVRGGSVAVIEACESRGTLTDRAQGDPSRGLAELLGGAYGGQVNSAGTLSGYTSPQTSHAAVIGSIAPRREQTGQDVVTAREVLDRYYQITVTDTGNNHHASAFQAAVATADALVIPVQPTVDSFAGMLRTLDQIATYDPQGTWLVEHATALITHKSELEPPEIKVALEEAITSRGLRRAEVPFDPEIRRGGEVAWERLSVTSQRAWTLAAAQVIETLHDAPESGPMSRTKAAMPAPSQPALVGN